MVEQAKALIAHVRHLQKHTSQVLGVRDRVGIYHGHLTELGQLTNALEEALPKPPCDHDWEGEPLAEYVRCTKCGAYG